jgi:hypothetical protein
MVFGVLDEVFFAAKFHNHLSKYYLGYYTEIGRKEQVRGIKKPGERGVPGPGMVKP